MTSVEAFPYRLRVNLIETIAPSYPGAQSSLKIGDMVYIGFQNYYAIQKAFSTTCRLVKRMVDPYALHITMSTHHTLKDITSYFSRYGPVHCVVDHISGKGRYAFVNFWGRESSLKALQDGTVHIVRRFPVKIRGKVLSAAEPHSPKPYSPARLTM